ncbi:uncharacterized protein LOC136093240 [Hydra vulgaris]|uniref:uncharacterized protein LOC136093240 n=1 Tax=Hydra vulgaris TaxID=6087 RepID=UPI0032EA65BD
MDRGKRQRLSGSQYKKIRLQREANSAKQKNALLHFLSRSSSEKALAPIVASTSNQNEVEIEIESGGELEYADRVSVNEYRNSGNDDTAKEPENVDEVEFISNLSEVVVQNVDDIGQNENNEDQSGEDPKTNKDLPLNFNDPAKWPIIDGKFKALLMKYGPIQKLPSLFPEDEQGRKFSTFFLLMVNLCNSSCLVKILLVNLGFANI